MLCAEPSDGSEHLPQVSTHPSTSHQPSQRSAFTGSATKAQAQERLADAHCRNPRAWPLAPGPAAATTPGGTADPPLKEPHKNTPPSPRTRRIHRTSRDARGHPVRPAGPGGPRQRPRGQTRSSSRECACCSIWHRADSEKHFSKEGRNH